MHDITLTAEQVAKINLSTLKAEKLPSIDNPEDAYELIKHFANEEREHFILVILDASNSVMDIQTVSIGTVSSSLVHPREVFRPAITQAASGIIVAHNHPSGNLRPSTADYQVTERLQECGRMIGINLVDHLVITKETFKSLI